MKRRANELADANCTADIKLSQLLVKKFFFQFSGDYLAAFTVSATHPDNTAIDEKQFSTAEFRHSHDNDNEANH